MDEDDPKDHVIICGMGHVGFRIVELLHRLGVPFTVIAKAVRDEWRDEIIEKAARFIEGDARQLGNLEKAGIAKAASLLAVTHNDLLNIEIALDTQKIAPDLPVVVRIFDQYLADRMMRETGIRNVFSPALLTAPVFVAAALGDERLRVFSVGGSPLHLLRLVFGENSPALGEMANEFCVKRGLVMVAVHPPSNGEDVPLKQGMEVVALGNEHTERQLQEEGLLSGKPKVASLEQFKARMKTLLHRPLRPFKTLRKIVRQTPPALRIPFVGLGVLLISSVAVFHRFHPETHRWIDAVYFVITMITTIGFGDITFKDTPDALKIYGCFVMLAGVALVAVLYGIITDYIVTLRVDQALGRRPTTLEDHCIVVGLGDVGTRVAEELINMGVPVVGIERDEDREAVPGLTDQFQVILADANRDSTLEKANVRRARAIIVTTTDDLTSLRIAHQAERINPALRSVVRIYDSSLAQKLSEGMGITHTANPAQAAAATIAAGALKAGVEYGFLYQERLLMLRWLTPFEVRKRALIGEKVSALRGKGEAVLLKRKGMDREEATVALLLDDLVEEGDALLILEEYDPQASECVSPRALFGAVL